MTSWHRNRRGRGCTTPRCRSQNIANNTFSEGWLQKSKEFAGLRTAPATHHAKNTANTTFSCGMLQNAGFGTIPCGGGGGGSEPRTGNIYMSMCMSCVFIYKYISVIYLDNDWIMVTVMTRFVARHLRWNPLSNRRSWSWSRLKKKIPLVTTCFQVLELKFSLVLWFFNDRNIMKYL